MVKSIVPVLSPVQSTSIWVVLNESITGWVMVTLITSVHDGTEESVTVTV